MWGPSLPARDQIRVPCFAGLILNHWTTREVAVVDCSFSLLCGGCWQATAWRPDPVCCLLVKIKFYWNTATPIHLLLSKATHMAQWLRQRQKAENIYYLVLNRKSLSAPTGLHSTVGRQRYLFIQLWMGICVVSSWGYYKRAAKKHSSAGVVKLFLIFF